MSSADLNKLPILVTGFNRPSLLKNVLSQIKFSPCRNIWLVIDGPRSNYPSDVVRVRECINIVKQFDFIVPSKRIFRNDNMGCKYGMAQAIDWFFSHNDMGVVIEDDLVFDMSFLNFQLEALTKFRDDKTVGSTTGYMPISAGNVYKEDPGLKIVKHNYFCAWGWGSWSDRWKYYEVEVSSWRMKLPHLKLLRQTNLLDARYWARRFDQLERGEIESWDFQFLFSHFYKGWVVVAPNKNLIGNIGFGDDATHTKKPRRVPPLTPLETKSFENMPIIQGNRNFVREYLLEQFGI